MHILGIFAIIYVIIRLIKEACEPTIPAENWANMDLYFEDMNRGVPIEQRMKNLEKGKYKLTEKYPEPHRDASGKIIIENSLLYKEDCRKYDALQVMTWVNQGKYNLSPEELKKEHERIRREMNW